MTRAESEARAESAERRAPGVQRVPIATLVEICGQDGVVPAFEGESCNVSGLGMQVRTSYLPEIGDSLVCRFEHEGSEILVEGRVAWRAEGEDGGEFGIQFTALDAGSVDVLQELSAGPQGASSEEEDDDTDEDVPRAGAEPGAKVRLHIEGLGAPMKARVQEGNPRKVRVGSNLEFLKVGRNLEIEDVQAGLRQGAHVDSVSVAVNPSTKVPELVVVLRYEGADVTPQPSVVEAARPAQEDMRQRELEAVADLDEEPAAETSGWLGGVDRFRQRLEGVARSASVAARQTGGALGRVAGSAAAGASKFAEGAGAQLSKRRSSSDRKRRTAASPTAVRSPVHALKGAVRGDATAPRRSARPQRATVALKQPVSDETGPNKRRLAALGVATVVVAIGATFAMRSLGDGSAATATPALSHTEPAAAAETVVAEPKADTQQATSKPASNGSSNDIVAEVPLFGPKAMATAEPAPLGADDVDTAQVERLAAAAAVDDESWEEEKTTAAASPADVKPWGRGKLHLPTIHRIRLDGPGGQLAGAMEPTGFTVVVPGRKAMEEGRGIEKRDKRIAQVKASNTDRGASITFKFRGSVPPYRVRLRKDFVEFFISAPEGEAAKL